MSHIRLQAQEKGIFLDHINAHNDHVQALINMDKTQSIANIMQQIKGESSLWINKQKVMPYKFNWQDDYFAVSIGHSQVNKVRNYIKNQDEHHKKMTWDAEVNLFIEKYGFDRIKG